MTTTAISKSGLSAQQLQTLKRTIAKDLTDIEFDLFMEACRSYQLDPFRRQIIPSIYNKDNRDKRSMTLITTRDGLRVIASRCGDYRPASEPAEFEFHADDWTHPGEGAPPNPQKIVSCTVRLWKKDMASGDWFPVVGQAFWDEYAPAGNAWKYSQWPKMPRVMIQKCAEAAALRAGWPDAFAGLYVAEELHHGDDDLPASQRLAQAEQERRQAMVGRGILFDVDGTKLEKIAVGQIFDRVSEAMRDMSDNDVLRFRERNGEGLREYWAAAPGDALELKKIMDPRCEAAIGARKQPEANGRKDQ